MISVANTGGRPAVPFVFDQRAGWSVVDANGRRVAEGCSVYTPDGRLDCPAMVAAGNLIATGSEAVSALRALVKWASENDALDLGSREWRAAVAVVSQADRSSLPT